MTESIRKIKYDINHLRRENIKGLVRIAILDQIEDLNLKDSLICLDSISSHFISEIDERKKIIIMEVIEEMKTDFRETINERAR